jgi:hypothetical protein
MQIELLKDVIVSVETGKNNKTYKSAEVNYKNLSDGKVSSKKLLQFDGAFKALSEGKEGQHFVVTPEKNDKGFWNWISAIETGENVAKETTNVAKTTTAPRSTYETPLEREKRQIYIVKQSSLERAFNLLAHNKGKEKITPEEVIEVAEAFVKYVFDFDFKDMDDDIL